MEGRPLDDDELIERAKDGDGDAFGELVVRYQAVAFRTAYAITRSAADAEDAAQEGFVKAYRAIGRFRAGAPFRPWLLRIVGNEARNRLRSAGRRDRLALRSWDPSSGDAAPSPEEAAVAAERRAVLLEALERLGQRDRTVITLRHLLGLSEAETAAALGVRSGTVKSRLSRGLARLRAELPESMGERP